MATNPKHALSFSIKKFAEELEKRIENKYENETRSMEDENKITPSSKRLV